MRTGKMKDLVFPIFILIALAVFIPFKEASSASKDEVYTLKFTSDASDRNPKCATLYDWAKWLKERTAGHLIMQIYPAGQLYNDKDAINAIGAGLIEMCQPPGHMLAMVDRNFEIEYLPSMIGHSLESYDGLKRPGGLYSKLGESIEAKLEVKVLGLIYAGDHCFATKNKPIVVLDDFKGLKMRIYGGAINMEKMRALGASPLQIAWPETYTALAQGIADGLETTLAGFNQQKLWEVQKYLMLSDHIRSSYFVMINRKAWDKLPANYQKVMNETLNEYTKLQDERIHQVDKECADSAIKGGMKTIRWDAQMLARYREKLQTIEDGYVKRFNLNPALVELARKSWKK